MEKAKATMREMQSENPQAVDELREKVLRRIEEMGEKPTPELVGSLVRRRGRSEVTFGAQRARPSAPLPPPLRRPRVRD